MTLGWEDVVAEARRIHWGAYLATVDASGVPHVSFVSPGFGGGAIWVASNADSAKVRNLQANTGVALHWPVEETTNRQLLIRGHGKITTELPARTALWESGFMPWELADWYSGPTDPTLAVIEITPLFALVDHAVGGTIGRWAPGSGAAGRPGS